MKYVCIYVNETYQFDKMTKLVYYMGIIGDKGMRVITSVNSQVIEQIGYDTYTRTCHVIINGSTYFYLNVSFKDFRRFYEADSKGSFFNRYVRGRW